MYYPPLFPTVRPFDPRANPLEVPIKRENPLDLSVKTIRPSSDTETEDLMMLDHRKLANLAASHSLSAMGRQLLDPTLFRLGYGTDAAAAAAMLPGLTAPFCYDRTTGVAVPTSLAGHQIMTNYLQQRERLEHQHQQALYAARTSAVAQQQAAVAAAAAAYMDPANLPLHLRNGLTQREAAAALAATRGLYAPTLPAPMVLPAFSLYTDDKGAFTSLRNSGRDNASEKSFLNGAAAASTPASIEAARYAEHFQRLRDLQQQHQTTGKCSNSCCTNTLSGLSQSSVPCACCVQTPSQAALCARSPMGCSTKDPASAATGKVCDFVQPSMSFLHRPTATTNVATTVSSSSELRLSVSSLCSTQTTTEPTTVSSSRDKHNSGFRPTTIWNAGLPSVNTTTTTSSSNKTAFSVPKRKESSSKDHHKEHKSSGSIKDILKDNHNNTSTSFETSKYDSFVKVNTTISSKSDSSKRNHEKNSSIFLNEDFSSRYYSRESSDVNSYSLHRAPTVIPPKSTNSNIGFITTHATTTIASTPTFVPSKSEGGAIPVSKLPPLLEAVRPAEPKISLEVPQEMPTTIPSPHGPPPLIAVSSTSDHLPSGTSTRSVYPMPENASMRMSENSTMRISENPAMRMPENTAMRMPDNSAMRISDNSAMRISDNSAMRMSENSAMRLSENSAIRMSENSAMRMSENSAMRMSENSAMRMCENSAMRMSSENSAMRMSSENSAMRMSSENSAMRMPENSALRMPENSALRMPENSALRMPENSALRMPENSALRMPENSALRMPENSTLRMPENSALRMPENSALRMSENSSLRIPENSALRIPENSALRMPTSLYPTGTLLLPSYKHSVEKSTSETATSIKSSSSLSSSSSKSPKKSTAASHSFPKFNGLAPAFGSEEPPPVPLSLPKPIPQLPTHHLASAGAPHPFSSHYRPAQHQLNLQNHNGWIPAANPNVTVAPIPQPITTATATITTTTSTPIVTTSHQPAKPQQTNFTASIKREPDYADTANVLQSLLIRPAPGLEALATLPPTTAAGLATSVVTPTNGLPLFGLDYRYPFPHQLLLNREGLPTASINCAPSTQINSLTSASLHRDIKTEISKVDISNHSVPQVSKHSSSKKRSSATPSTEETVSSKKRLLTSDFVAAHNQTRYSFQPTSFASEAAEAPECPYTFIPEPPLNFSGQFKSEDSLKSARKEIIPVKTQDVPEASYAPSKSPVLVPVPPKSSTSSEPPCLKQSPPTVVSEVNDRGKAFRAKRRLRKKLLARIYQQRRPLINGTIVQPDPSVIDRQLTVRYARKLLSQLTLRWAHRRYVHKWQSMKRKSMTKVLKLKKRRKDGKLVYKIKKEAKVNKKLNLQEETSTKGNETVPIPSEMKRLMVNKALGETTLHRAARLGYPEAVAYCLQTKCVSVNARDNAGYTPLHECCSRGHLDIARALLQYGADVNASAAGGIRPLHDAVENDHVEIVRLLLSYGADPTIATYSGLEPMKLARSPMMAEFLQGFFADISGEADCRPHLPWRFWGSAKCLDPEDCGYDVLGGVPSDPQCEGEGDDDFLFEVSDSPHLPTFRLLLPAANTKAQCNYLRLNDVLRKLCMTKEEFHYNYSYIEVLTLPSHEFEASAMCSPLLTGTKLDTPLLSRPCSDRLLDNGSFTDLVRLDSSIRQVLGIETICVR